MNHDDHPIAACAGQWDLFDSTDVEDHIQARLICKSCPMLDSCRDQLQAARVDSYPGVRSRGGGPVGTWAGDLVGAKNGHHYKPKRDSCGTPAGYYDHNNNSGETPCALCMSAFGKPKRIRIRRAA